MARSARGSKIIGLLSAALLLVVAGIVALGSFSFGATKEVDRTGPALLHSLEDLSEYRAATGSFQVVVDVERDNRLLPDFLAGERALMVATGRVDAAVDFGELDEDSIKVSDDRTSVAITLPHAQLTEARIDNDRTYVASRDRGLTDRVSDALSPNPVDDSALYQKAEDQLEAAAADAGVREQAEENTVKMLEGLLTSLGFETVVIEFDESTAT